MGIHLESMDNLDSLFEPTRWCHLLYVQVYVTWVWYGSRLSIDVNMGAKRFQKDLGTRQGLCCITGFFSRKLIPPVCMVYICCILHFLLLMQGDPGDMLAFKEHNNAKDNNFNKKREETAREQKVKISNRPHLTCLNIVIISSSGHMASKGIPILGPDVTDGFGFFEHDNWRSTRSSSESESGIRSIYNAQFLRGLNSVLLLRVQLVSSLLDMLARPTFWGLPMELGLMLPFPCAFFPGKQKRMVELLSGPVSCRHFQEIVGLMEHDNASPYFDSSGTAILMTDDSTAVDHNSAWSMLLDFPIWFHFAAMLLFRWEQCLDKFGPLEFDSEMNVSEQYVSDLHCSAAIYLGWVLSPTNSTYRNMMILLLKEASVSWMEHRKFNTHVLYVGAGSRHPSLERKNRKSAIGDFDKVCMASENEKSMMSIGSWLMEFQTLHINCYNRSGFSGFSSTNEELHAFLRKILLGIFTGNISTLDYSECEVLFHYVSSGQILAVEEVIAGEETVTGRPEDHEHIQRKCSWEKIKLRHVNWIQVTVFMFDLFDILEDMVLEVLEYEYGVKYICHAKAKSVRYLTNCISRILQASDLCEIEMLIDLKGLFLGWMQQGSELFDGHDECNELALALGCKIYSMQQV